MPRHYVPEDLYLSAVLLQHQVVSNEQLDGMQRITATTPGLTLADALVEAGFLSFEQRKALKAQLINSDAIRDMLAGRLSPARLDKISIVRDVNDDTLPEGISRDMAATRLEPTDDRVGLDDEVNPNESTQTVHEMPTSTIPVLEDEKYADTENHKRDDQDTLSADHESTVSTDRADHDTIMDAAGGSVAGTDDPQATLTRDPGSTLIEPRSESTSPDLAVTEPDLVASSEAGGFMQTVPAALLASGEQGPQFGSFMSASAAGLFDSMDVNLIEAAQSGSFDVSSILSEAEFSRIKESAEVNESDLIGHKLGGYVIIDKLGQGGMGEVFLAKQLSLNRYVALKVLPEAYASDPQFIERFIHEANMLAKLSHSNVVRVFDVARAGDLLYITMENVEGGSLRDLITKEKQVPLDVAINIIKQCCRALGRVKKEGLTHRDIKPGNILLNTTGEVKVVDFGLADVSRDLEKRPFGHAAGTPYYMAPESIKNQPATHLSDQYSLGATLFHMLVGAPPFCGKTLQETQEKHVHEDVPRASDTVTSLPEGIDFIIRRMMAKNPVDRFRSFREAFEALEELELNAGLIKTQEAFLSEGLLNLRDANIENIKGNIAWWSFVAFAYCLIGMLTSAFIRTALPGADAAYWVAHAGNFGTWLVTLAYVIILYVGSVRTRRLPGIWSIRRWIQVHIFFALTGTFLVMVHSGNFLRDYIGFSGGQLKPVPILPMLNSLVLMLVVASGMIGRFIYNDLRKQAALDNLALESDEEDKVSGSRGALIVISQRTMGYWRIFHYPLTIIWLVLTVAHIISVLYFGGSLGVEHPNANWFPGAGN